MRVYEKLNARRQQWMSNTILIQKLRITRGHLSYRKQILTKKLTLQKLKLNWHTSYKQQRSSSESGTRKSKFRSWNVVNRLKLKNRKFDERKRSLCPLLNYRPRQN